MYVPELIFGHLLTSSNYNDDEQKVPCIITSVVLATQLELVQQGVPNSTIVCRSLVAGMAMVPSSPTSFRLSSLWRHVMGREAVDTSRLFWCIHHHVFTVHAS